MSGDILVPSFLPFRKLMTSALFAGAALAASTAQALDVAGLAIPDRAKVGNADLVLNGAKLIRRA